MSKRKSTRGDYEIEDLGDYEMSAEAASDIESKIKSADAELDATRVNFRWHKEPLGLVKSVAEAMGVPYQTYIKQVLYRQALEDMRSIRANAVVHNPSQRPISGHLIDHILSAEVFYNRPPLRAHGLTKSYLFDAAQRSPSIDTE